MQLARGPSGGFYNPVTFKSPPKVDLSELIASQQQYKSRFDRALEFKAASQSMKMSFNSDSKDHKIMASHNLIHANGEKTF